MASQLLPAAKKRSAFALYAFCRVADDLVDDAGDEPPAILASRLQAMRVRLNAALAGQPDDALFREVAGAMHRHGIPAALLHELLDGIAVDCLPARFANWPQLEAYCEGVASSVGEMCTYVFGVEDGRVQRAATIHARQLGVAMQLTNILRDVGEDARRLRCYLPDSDLAHFGLTRAEVLSGSVARDVRWRRLMQFEIARARELYAAAAPGLAMLSTDARRCATACATGYAAILDAIEALDYDTFTARAHLGPVARAAVLWGAWRAPLAPPVRGTDTGARGHGLLTTP